MAAPRKAEDRIGTGLALPFRFLGGAGFATASGADVVLAQLEIVLGETCAAPGTPGSLPYNQTLGTLARRLRHKATSDPATREMAVYYVLDKCKQLVPLARLRRLRFTPSSAKRMIVLELSTDVLDRPGGSPIKAGLQTAVTL
jgi:hypothetical protein